MGHGCVRFKALEFAIGRSNAGRRGEDLLIGAGRRMTFPGANDWRFFTVIIEEIARQIWAWGRLFHNPR